LSLFLSIDPYAAAELADLIRRQLVRERASFVFETVFSDPVGDKIAFLKETESAGYTVVLIFIGVSGASVSGDRVAMRASQGGHDVPALKLAERFPRVLRNLARALEELSHVFVYDNSDLKQPYRPVAEKIESGKLILHKPVPKWLHPLLP
jgi:predicted ABC-type ATPase